MNKITISIILLVVCLTISGQQISQSNNRYRGNDALEKKQITVKGFDLNSKNCVWSLVNPRSLLKHLNTKSQKSNSHVYKR